MLPLALSLAAQFAPAMLQYLTGSETAGAVAGKVVDIASLVTGGSADPVAALKADPALALQFQQKVMENETEIERMYLGDVQNARDRDARIAEAGRSNHRANALAAVAVLLVLVCLLIVVWGSDMDDFAKGMVTLICGRALGWVEQIFSFEYGTTRANKVKDDTINNLTK